MRITYPPPIKVVAIADGLNHNTYSIVSFLLHLKKDFIPKFIIDDNFSKSELKSNFGLIREHNCNYAYMSDGRRLEIISTEDSIFLHQEGRITHFVIIASNDEDIKNVTKKYQISIENMIILKSI